MFLKVTKLIGKPICVLLYAVFGVMAALTVSGDRMPRLSGGRMRTVILPAS